MVGLDGTDGVDVRKPPSWPFSCPETARSQFAIPVVVLGVVKERDEVGVFFLLPLSIFEPWNTSQAQANGMASFFEPHVDENQTLPLTDDLTDTVALRASFTAFEPLSGLFRRMDTF